MVEKELYIILVNWKKPDLTLNCIKSIKNSNYKNYEIIVVENGSEDNSIEVFNKHNNNDFHLLVSSYNLGYTGGNNLGINYSLSKNAKYILLLNNDTIIKIDTLNILISTINSDQNIGIVQPKIFFYPNFNLIWSGPTKYNKFLISSRLVGYGKIDCKLVNTKQELDFAVGCATLIKSQVFNKIGLLDDDFFAVCEDVDFGIRAKKLNYKIIYEPMSVVYHLESISAGGINNFNYVYLQTRSQILLIKKHTSNTFHFYIAFYIYFLRALYRAINLIKMKNYKAAHSIFIAFKNYYTNKLNLLKP
jgi:GT2 family glycosyltransferase